MHLRSALALAVDLAASLLSPPRCAACDEPVARTSAFCAACASTVERALDRAFPSFAAFVYGGAVARAITRMKYEGRPDLARVLGALLAHELAPHAAWLSGAVLVPVPLHISRLVTRGFNQSALIASTLSLQLRIPMFPLALMRNRDTPKQASLQRAERIANVEGAFRVASGRRLAGRRVLLVDDVRTTGVTIDACTRVLVGAGAASVAHAVVARA